MHKFEDIHLMPSLHSDQNEVATSGFVTETIQRPAFRVAVEYAVRQSLRSAIPAATIRATPEPNWPFALLCASSMTDIQSDERAQQNVLRIAQGCLASESATDLEREAARTLLLRVGNSEAVKLAKRRNHIRESYPSVVIPASQAWETAATHAAYAINLLGEESLQGNPFQRKFWDVASKATWFSVSAPTSAGKSFILRKWIQQGLLSEEIARVVYLTPTRALVEETSRAFLSEVSPAISVITMPWDDRILQGAAEIYVLTQERLHLVQQFNPDFTFDLLVVDEAQKISEESRGIIMSSVIDESAHRNSRLRVIFASPMSSNPEALLRGAPTAAKSAALVDGTCTVNQNLLYVNQVRGDSRLFRIDATTEGFQREVGSIRLPDRPTSVTMRMAMLVLAMGEASTSNLVYANGPGTAQKMADRLAEYRDSRLIKAESASALAEAIEYISSAIHPRFSLCTALSQGVAFHYGPIPLHVKEVIEELFKSGHVKYLVCTSTLLEGVNLPCTNIFVRAPKKGSADLQSADFWNLAGRAGRWGKEYQGNIVCIDTSMWRNVPSTKTRQVISRAADLDDEKVELLEAFARKTVTTPSDSSDSGSEALLGLLSSRAVNMRGVADITGVFSDPELASRADAAVNQSLKSVSLPAWLLARHASISPNRIQSLVDFFGTVDDVEGFALPSPEGDDSAAGYTAALEVISAHLGGPFGSHNRRLSLGRLIVRWMRGDTMKRIIDDRYFYHNARSGADWRVVIDKVMDDVEKICRFEAPKYLACYSDALNLAAGRQVGFESSRTVTMMLELGVPRLTDMSLIALGLSRATTVAVGELQFRSDLGPAAVADWLRSVDWPNASVQAFAAREVQRLLPELPIASNEN